MKRTRIRALVATAGVSALVVWTLEWILVSRGFPAVIPPLTLSAVVGLIGVALPAFAWPIRERVRSDFPTRSLDPFYATRVLLLAQASSRAAALLSGAAVGVLIFVLSRPVIHNASVGLTFAAVAGAIVLVIGALVAERWCTLPPGDSRAADHDVAEGEPV